MEDEYSFINKSTAKKVVYFLIFMVALLTGLIFASIKTVQEINNIGLKNIVSEFWEGTNNKGEIK